MAKVTTLKTFRTSHNMEQVSFHSTSLKYLHCLCYTAAAQSLVQLLHEAVDEEVMSQFVQTFLLESNSTAVRWQAHELLYSMHK